jgi:L-arabinonolactonase
VKRTFSATPQVALDCRNGLGESIVWDDRSGVLHWTNINDRELWTWDPFGGEGAKVAATAERVGALGLRETDGLVLALEKGFALWRNGAAHPISAVDTELPTVRLNDGRVDPAGRFVCGGMDEGSPQRPLARLYGLDPKRGASTLLEGVSCTNSLCWSPDGRTLYFTDMPTRRIDAFDYDLASGGVSNRRVFVSLADEPGLADGSIVDAEGCLWNAQWQGSKLVRYRPDGTVEREVALPVSNPTCMAFGGPDLDILFVTTAWFTLTPEQRAAEPLAGNLFAFRPGVRGRKEARYAG